MTLRIVIGAHSADISEHAVRVIEARKRNEDRHPLHAIPIGVAAHLTRYPIVCDDCGETFWAADQYASHAKCKRGRQFGF